MTILTSCVCSCSTAAHSKSLSASTSHTHTLLSRPHVASSAPEADHVTLLTSFSWPSRLASSSYSPEPVLYSHTATVASKLAVASWRESGENETERIVRWCASVSRPASTHCVPSCRWGG